jgi:hypothetical protein
LSLKEIIDRGGNAWLPPEASSGSASIVSLTEDLGPLAKEAAAFKVDPRRALNPDTNRQFRSVAEMVLWERENSIGSGFRSNAQILDELRADGFILGGSSSSGTSVRARGSNTSLAGKLAGRTPGQYVEQDNTAGLNPIQPIGSTR